MNRHKMLRVYFFLALMIVVLSQNVFAGINLIYGYDPRFNLQFKESGTTGLYNSDTAFFYGLEYQSPISESLSFTLGGVNAGSRPLKSYASGGSYVDLSNMKASFSYTSLHANLIYNVWGPFSVFGGLNYPLFISVNKGSGGPDVSLSGNFGYQYGFNVAFLEHLQFEVTLAEYLNFGGKNNANGASITEGELIGERYVGSPTRNHIRLKLVDLNKLFNLF